MNRSILSLALGIVVAAAATGEQAAETPPLTRAAEVHALSVEQAGEGRPVRLEGLLTFVDREWNGVFFHDESGGVFVKAVFQAGGDPQIRSGARVTVEGVTGRGDFLPWVQGPDGGAATIRVTGYGPLPPGKPVSGPQLVQPPMDCALVEVWGVVRPPPATSPGAVFAVESEGRTFLAYLPQDASPRELSPSLLGVPVWVRAVAATMVNQRRQMTRRILCVPSVELIKPESPAPAEDPFKLPLVPFDDLLRSHVKNAHERARVKGVVTMAFPDEGLFLREQGGGGLWVQTSQGLAGSGIRSGSVVEAVGWPEATDFRPDIHGALLRVVDTGPPPPPLAMSVKQALTTRHHADLVAVEGTLIGRFDDSRSTRLLLHEEGVMFEARMPLANGAGDSPQWVRDSRLRVTGVCQNLPIAALGSPQTSETFFLRTRGPQDVRVLSSPPWWSTRRILWLLGGTVGAAVLAGGWAFALRRRVAAQTAVIQEQVHRAGVQEERHRLARELHDSLEQEITGIGLQLETALARIDGQGGGARQSLEQARRLLQRVQRETRETIWELRLSPSDPHVLPAVLRETLAPLTDATGAVLRVECPARVPEGLPAPLMHHLLRIVHEAVANAARHGRARQVKVRLGFSGDSLRAEVEDDGAGFDPGAAPGANQGHFGLTGMQERAAKCDGTLEIHSRPGHGTRIVLAAPLDFRSPL